MFYALSGFVLVSLLLLWSLVAWAFHSIAVWTVSNAGALGGGTESIEALNLPLWLAPWVSTELVLIFSSLFSALKPAIESVLGWAPALVGGLSMAVWAVWGIGAVVLIVLGLLATGLIAVLRRRPSTAATSSASPATSR